MNAELRNLLDKLKAAILTANARTLTDRPRSCDDWQVIEAMAQRATGFAMAEPLNDSTVGTVELPCPSHPGPAQRVGNLGWVLRERGYIVN